MDGVKSGSELTPPHTNYNKSIQSTTPATIRRKISSSYYIHTGFSWERKTVDNFFLLIKMYSTSAAVYKTIQNVLIHGIYSIPDWRCGPE